MRSMSAVAEKSETVRRSKIERFADTVKETVFMPSSHS